MAEFTSIYINYHPRISSEIVRYVCYNQPASYASLLDIRLTAVEYLQRYDQSNISKMDARLKRVDSFNTKADNTSN